MKEHAKGSPDRRAERTTSDHNVANIAIQDFENGTYQGTLRRHDLSGKGLFFWNEGDAYFGDWRDNLIHGYGDFFFAEGGSFMGHFKMGKAHGLGKLLFADGDLYFGFWVDGVMHGRGLRYFQQENRWVYSEYIQGEEKHVIQTGEGKPKNFDLTVILPHEDDILEVLMVSTNDPVGRNKFDGTIHSGMKQGLGTFVMNDGVRLQGNWINDTLCGVGIQWNPKGALQVGFFKNGVLGGVGRILYENGDIYYGSIADGKYHGTGIYFNKGVGRWIYAVFNNNKPLHILEQGTSPPPSYWSFQKGDTKGSSALAIAKPLILTAVNESPVIRRESAALVESRRSTSKKGGKIVFSEKLRVGIDDKSRRTSVASMLEKRRDSNLNQQRNEEEVKLYISPVQSESKPRNLPTEGGSNESTAMKMNPSLLLEGSGKRTANLPPKTLKDAEYQFKRKIESFQKVRGPERGDANQLRRSNNTTIAAESREKMRFVGELSGSKPRKKDRTDSGVRNFKEGGTIASEIALQNVFKKIQKYRENTKSFVSMNRRETNPMPSNVETEERLRTESQLGTVEISLKDLRGRGKNLSRVTEARNEGDPEQTGRSVSSKNSSFVNPGRRKSESWNESLRLDKPMSKSSYRPRTQIRSRDVAKSNEEGTRYQLSHQVHEPRSDDFEESKTLLPKNQRRETDSKLRTRHTPSKSLLDGNNRIFDTSGKGSQEASQSTLTPLKTRASSIAQPLSSSKKRALSAGKIDLFMLRNSGGKNENTTTSHTYKPSTSTVIDNLHKVSENKEEQLKKEESIDYEYSERKNQISSPLPDNGDEKKVRLGAKDVLEQLRQLGPRKDKVPDRQSCLQTPGRSEFGLDTGKTNDIEQSSLHKRTNSLQAPQLTSSPLKTISTPEHQRSPSAYLLSSYQHSTTSPYQNAGKQIRTLSTQDLLNLGYPSVPRTCYDVTRTCTHLDGMICRQSGCAMPHITQDNVQPCPESHIFIQCPPQPWKLPTFSPQK